MARKVISYILVFLFLIGSVTSASAAGTSATVNCSFSKSDNRITVNWDGVPSISKIKILRDGVVYKEFSEIPANGSFDVIETEKGIHKFKVIVCNSVGTNITESGECFAEGLGEPQIYLEFLNKYVEITPPINMRSTERLFNWVRVYNQGTIPLELKKIKVRYFYTIDGEPKAAENNPDNGQELIEASDQRFNPNYEFKDGKARDEMLSAMYVRNKFFRMARHITTADYICQTYFSDTETKIDSKYNFKIQPSFHKQHLSDRECNEKDTNYIRNYDVTNDYSYNNNQNIAVYYDNEPIWGNDPSVFVPEHLTAVFDVSRIKLSWDTCPGAVDYIVYRSENGEDFNEIGTIGTPQISDRQTYFDEDIQSSSTERYNGKDYYYKVRAVYDDGIKSKFSKIVKVTADPFISNQYWDLSVQIVGKNAKSPYFALGTYIPVNVTLRLKKNITNPEIILRNDVCEATNANKKFIANLVPKNTGSSYLRITSTQTNAIIDGNTLRFLGSYGANSEFAAQYVLKVSPSSESLTLGIKSYYDNNYLLNFGVQGFQNGSKVEVKDSDKALKVKILKPDKLR